MIVRTYEVAATEASREIARVFEAVSVPSAHLVATFRATLAAAPTCEAGPRLAIGGAPSVTIQLVHEPRVAGSLSAAIARGDVAAVPAEWAAEVLEAVAAALAAMHAADVPHGHLSAECVLLPQVCAASWRALRRPCMCLPALAAATGLGGRPVLRRGVTGQCVALDVDLRGAEP